MPDKVLRIVAGLLAFCALSGLVLGIAGAPQRGRLPGEAVGGGSGAPMVATEARPYNSEELAPKPAGQDEEPPPEKAAVEEAKLAPPEKAPAPKAPTLEQAAPPDEVGAILEAAPPPPEDPPF